MLDTPEVSEGDAKGIVKEIYANIKLTYRVPFIVTFYRQLAAYPKCLDFIWNQVKPLLQTEYIQTQAKRLQSLAQLPGFDYETVSQELQRIPREMLKDALITSELLNYSNAQNAIISNSLHLSYQHGRIGGSIDAKKVTNIQPSRETDFSMVNPSTADDNVRRIFEEIRAVRGLVPTFYRVLAKSPEMLYVVWNRIKETYRTEQYGALLEKILKEAQEMAVRIPLAVNVSHAKLSALGLDESQLYNVRTILEGFSRNIPAMLLEIEIAKVAMVKAQNTWKALHD